MLLKPSPSETATIPKSLGGSCFVSLPALSAALSRRCCTIFSILRFTSSPSACPNSSALPGSLVCTCTLTSDRSPTTSTQSPMRFRRRRKESMSSSFIAGSRFWDQKLRTVRVLNIIQRVVVIVKGGLAVGGKVKPLRGDLLAAKHRGITHIQE